FFFGNVVHVGIIPAVAGVGLIRVIDAHSAVVKQAESLRGLPVVLHDFRAAVGKIVIAMIDAVGEGKFRKILIGENFFHFPADVFIQAVIFVYVEKSSVLQVCAQTRNFVFGQV